MIKTLYQCATPEGVLLEAELAGPVVRSLAYAIDLAIRGVVIIAVSFAVAFAEKAGMGLVMITSFLLEWLYPVFFEVLRNGQTPGKKALQLAVVHDNLTPVSLASSLTRNLLRAADFLPFMYVVGFICSLFNREFKRLGDIAAGTVVIHRVALAEKAKHSTDTTFDITPLNPQLSLAMEEQLALLEFYDRKHTLSQARREELAQLLKPLLPHNTNPEKTVLAMGAWLAGR